MNYFIGLGNPGTEYENTRHNTGRIILDFIKNKNDFSEWKVDKKINALVSKGKIEGKSVVFILPETFMNNSGKTVKALNINSKSTGKVCVIYDDLDLPLGKNKLSFNRSSGGHNGLNSIIKALKTEKFPRFRIGISPLGNKGIKKPIGEEKVHKHIMGKFNDEEIKILKNISKDISETIPILVSESVEKAMTSFNSK